MSTTCACGSCTTAVEHVLATPRGTGWTWDRCSSLRLESDRRLCRLSQILKEEKTTMSKPDDEDLIERLRPHAKKGPAHERSATGIYRELRQMGYSHTSAAAGAVNAISHAPAAAAKLSEDTDEGPGPLPEAIAEMIGPLLGYQREEVELRFQSTYARLRKKMAAARARLEAATSAQSEAERFLGLLGVRPAEEPLITDPYYRATSELANLVEAVTRRDPKKTYAQALAEVVQTAPSLVDAFSGPRRNEDD